MQYRWEHMSKEIKISPDACYQNTEWTELPNKNDTYNTGQKKYQ